MIDKSDTSTENISLDNNSEVNIVEHSHSDNCTCELGKENVETKSEQHQNQLTFKEIKALKKSRYRENIMNNPKFRKSYVLGNKKTGQIVEIRAASSFHACQIIGWKSTQVKILLERDIPEEVSQTNGSSGN